VRRASRRHESSSKSTTATGVVFPNFIPAYALSRFSFHDPGSGPWTVSATREPEEGGNYQPVDEGESTMIELIEVPEDARNAATEIPGWRISLSRKVWQQCVAVPKGVEGQTEGGRLNDLLIQLGYNLRLTAVPRHLGLSAGFGFCVNVMNENHDRSEFPDGLEWPGLVVPLAALASIDQDGAPSLVVMAQQEANCA
jgi:hypothetical protein